MLAARIFLALCAVLWLPYGLMCLVNPGSLAEAAGVVATSATGTVELRAMYGGLQAAVGALALAGALRPDLAPHALLALGSLSAGLGITRLASAVLAGSFESYTLGALTLEWTMLIAVLALWRRAQPASAA
jgi:Domain of unknown function (DUF4345)